jgi:hypothetical protein
MADTTPFFVRNVPLVGTLSTPQVIAKGGLARGTLDLTTDFGAEFMVSIGKGGTTAFSVAGITMAFAKSIAQAGPSTKVHGNSLQTRLGNSATCNGNSTIGADAAVGAATITVASGTGFAAGDKICIQDAGGGVTRLEYNVISKISGTTITLRHLLQYAHTAAQADTVRNTADIFVPISFNGGDIVEVVADFGAETGADSLTVQVLATVYTKMVTA